jgi:hypothetical protein
MVVERFRERMQITGRIERTREPLRPLRILDFELLLNVLLCAVQALLGENAPLRRSKMDLPGQGSPHVRSECFLSAVCVQPNLAGDRHMFGFNAL